MPPFTVEPQIHRDACVAAAACSLLRWLGLPARRQEELDPLVQAGMRSGKSGFESLGDALAALGSGCAVTRHTPSPRALVRWIESTPAAARGFLISHHVQTPRGRRAHVTVVFAEGGRWCHADPATAEVRSVELQGLVDRYAGDVATFG